MPLATLGFVTETAPAPPSLSENVLDLTEGNLALFEEESLSQSEKKWFADLGAQRGSVFTHSSDPLDLRFMQTNNQEPERETRRDSRSRPRQEPETLPRRDSVDSDKIRRKEVRKIGEILKTELRRRGEVRDEIRDAPREAAAEDKVRHWPASGSYPLSTSSNHVTGQDDMWSSPPSSNGRSPKYIQQQRLKREPRVYMEERPRMQRRVTDFAGIWPRQTWAQQYYCQIWTHIVVYCG